MGDNDTSSVRISEKLGELGRTVSAWRAEQNKGEVLQPPHRFTRWGVKETERRQRNGRQEQLWWAAKAAFPGALLTAALWRVCVRTAVHTRHLLEPRPPSCLQGEQGGEVDWMVPLAPVLLF